MEGSKNLALLKSMAKFLLTWIGKGESKFHPCIKLDKSGKLLTPLPLLSLAFILFHISKKRKKNKLLPSPMVLDVF